MQHYCLEVTKGSERPWGACLTFCLLTGALQRRRWFGGPQANSRQTACFSGLCLLLCSKVPSIHYTAQAKEGGWSGHPNGGGGGK